MCSLRDFIIFLAGVETFHTLMHLIFATSNLLPMKILFYTLTPQLNFFGIVINAIITIGLINWAARLPYK